MSRRLWRASRAASLNTLADDLQTVVSGNQDTLGQAVQDAERTLHHTRRTARSPERSAEDLAAILSGLREGRGTAGRLLNDPRLYRRADTLALRLNRLLKDVEENPGHYVGLGLLTSPAPKRNAVQWKNRAHGAKSSVSPTA